MPQKTASLLFEVVQTAIQVNGADCSFHLLRRSTPGPDVAALQPNESIIIMHYSSYYIAKTINGAAVRHDVCTKDKSNCTRH